MISVIFSSPHMQHIYASVPNREGVWHHDCWLSPTSDLSDGSPRWCRSTAWFLLHRLWLQMMLPVPISRVLPSYSGGSGDIYWYISHSRLLLFVFNVFCFDFHIYHGSASSALFPFFSFSSFPALFFLHIIFLTCVFFTWTSSPH